MCKTLIVEDNVTFRQMLKEGLRSRFPTMEIEEEPDGRDLFNKIDSFHPKIVFMDIRLPGENGLELTKKIKMNHPDIIVVILTSYDLPEYRQAARETIKNGPEYPPDALDRKYEETLYDNYKRPKYWDH